MFRSLYAQILYWLALRFQVVHPIMFVPGGKRPLNREYTRWEKIRININARLMAASNNIMITMRERDMVQERYDTTMRVLLNGVSHNPNRKDPEGTVL